jgi:hypothetical protein
LTVKCKGLTVFVMLNGETVTELDMRKWTSAKRNPDGSKMPPRFKTPLAKMPTKGYIGLSVQEPRSYSSSSRRCAAPVDRLVII